VVVSRIDLPATDHLHADLLRLPIPTSHPPHTDVDPDLRLRAMPVTLGHTPRLETVIGTGTETEIGIETETSEIGDALQSPDGTDLAHALLHLAETTGSTRTLLIRGVGVHALHHPGAAAGNT
jgi:hypothetical protein